MIAILNQVVEYVEQNLDADIDIDALATSLGTTDYHVRRMFSSLAGMPLSEYVRRRRMTVAAAALRRSDSLLDIATRYGYGSTEAFGRAFRAVHGVGPADVRREGGPLRSQPQLRFRLTVEGNTPMDTRITDRPRSDSSGMLPACPHPPRTHHAHPRPHRRAAPYRARTAEEPQ